MAEAKLGRDISIQHLQILEWDPGIDLYVFQVLLKRMRALMEEIYICLNHVVMQAFGAINMTYTSMSLRVTPQLRMRIGFSNERLLSWTKSWDHPGKQRMTM